MSHEHLSPSQFRAEMDVFVGPLDLLLHLVQQKEVDITEVALAETTDRYLAAVKTMDAFDINVAGEFLVIAATLIELKSRGLLPTPPVLDEEDDPGAELVRRLLEYKEFKQAAGHLGERAEQRADRWARPHQRIEADADEEPDPAALIEDLATWDLMVAFSRVLEQTSVGPTTRVLHSDIPVSAYIEEVTAHLRNSRHTVTFLDFFAEEYTRPRIIGVFLALLELIRLRTITVSADSSKGGSLAIHLCGPRADEEEA
jgi:segregation and condensation protein A